MVPVIGVEDPNPGMINETFDLLTMFPPVPNEFAVPVSCNVKLLYASTHAVPCEVDAVAIWTLT